MASTAPHTITLDPTKYDAEQINLMEERLILLDNDDNAIGEGSKKDCHLIPPPGSSQTRSPLHRAFSVFLFHPETGKLLLQRRADEKITFPGMWTNTCCSHPLTSNGEMDEQDQIGVRRAAARKLTHELGIPHTYPLDDFAYLTRIHYYAPSDEIWAEHEIDYIFFLTLDPKYEVNPNEVSDTKWVSKADLEAFFQDPASTFTPWFRLIAESFLYKWWDALLASRPQDGSALLDAKALVAEVEKDKEAMGQIIRIPRPPVLHVDRPPFSPPRLALTPKELHDLVQQEDGAPVVLDASWHMPAAKRLPFQEYRKKRIEGAAFWDVDQIASTSDVGVPHNMPSVAQFEDACSRLGIERDSHVVVYDTVGVFSSPRTAFTFKHFGHDKVSVLDGGLPRWQADGLPLDTTSPTNPNPHAVAEDGSALRALYCPIFSELLYAHKPKVESYFIADIEERFSDYKVEAGGEAEHKEDLRQWEDMNRIINESDKEREVIIDARAAGRFHGTDPEPREGLSSGHMPHSLSLPFQSVLTPESSTTPPYRTMLSPDELEKVFEGVMGSETWHEVKSGKRGIVSTCGSGMTASILWLALQRAGVIDNAAIYDESWTGYASRPESVIEKS